MAARSMLGFGGTREWVEAQSVTGTFTTIRRWTFLALHLILLATPWIPVGGHPAIRVDLPHRQVFAFGQVYTAADTIFLLIILLFLAFSLFFFTSLFGRLWCGYACPQTVFLETWIRPIEQWIEGDRSRRLRRQRQGFTVDLVWRRAVKWLVFAGVAVVVAMAFVSYFGGAREMWTGQGGPVEYGVVVILAAIFFLDFAWFREQFCNYLCPYARFQGALTDRETIQVTYFPARGEPRGGKTAAADGRCIECNKCVVVCPQGIDIRDGFQLECIACSRCIDACHGVMQQLGHPSLVGYSSLAEMEGGKRPRMLRPRTLAYAALLVGLVVSGVAMARGRVPFEVTVNRAPGSLFTVDADGAVRNTYLLKVTSNEAGPEPVTYAVRVDGLPDAQVIVPDFTLRPSESHTGPLVIRLAATDTLARTMPFRVVVSAPSGEVVVAATFKTGAHAGDE